METLQTTGTDITINLDGITICYDDFGKGILPVIFIHGFPFDKSSWQPQMEFSKNTNRVIAYDIRGFGKSTSDNQKASMSLFADDLIKLMDALEIHKAIVCGLSMGGYVLLNAVTLYPERFEAIILSDTQCIADSPEGKEKRYKTIEHIEAGGLNDFADGFIKNVFCQESLDTKKELVERIKTIVLTTSSATIAGTLAALAERSEMCSSLNKISVPALILCGKEDKVTPLAQSEILHQQITGSTLHSIAQAGHLSNLEQPEIFNRHVTEFISAL
ncbi:MAG TPA: alpha/beta hydrolase [Bacteroidia bacterium]|nr:alpha/beta hydrolase [Bacteroidia bacterium]